jgi:hypothetical protein
VGRELKPARLKTLLALGGVLETVVGLGLIAAPSALAFVLLRAPLEGAGIAVARIAGAGLLSLGIACWRSRGDATSPAGLSVSWGLLAYNLLACVVLALACPPLSGGGLVAAGAAAVHGAVGVALLAALLGRE